MGIRDIIDKNIQDRLTKTTSQSGKYLKISLGLSEFQFVVIRKILNISMPIYLVFYDSRRPNVFLSQYKIKHLRSLILQKTKRSGFEFIMKDFKLSPPLSIEDCRIPMITGMMIIKMDIAGEYFRNDSIHITEDVLNKIEVIQC